MKSHWPLNEVKKVASTRNGLIIKRSRALDFFSTNESAYMCARNVISRLTEKDFAESKQQQFNEWFDTYAFVLNGAGWMMKFTLEEYNERVLVISFHPLEREMKTKGGIVRP